MCGFPLFCDLPITLKPILRQAFAMGVTGRAAMALGVFCLARDEIGYRSGQSIQLPLVFFLYLMSITVCVWCTIPWRYLVPVLYLPGVVSQPYMSH